MKGELNVWDITVSTDESKWCTLSADPNNKLLGKRFGKGALLIFTTDYTLLSPRSSLHSVASLAVSIIVVMIVS
jgi:hypothetical protein